MNQALIKPFIKYTSAGGLATIVHYVVFFAVIHLTSRPAWQATLFASIIGALVAYLLNYHYTFLSKVAHLVLLPKFLVVATLGVIVQTFIVAALNQHWHLHYLLAQIIATGFGLVLTFSINNFWTFNERFANRTKN